MIIREAITTDQDDLFRFYDEMCKVLDGKEFLPDGDKGGFPSREMVKNAILQHYQFIGIEDNHIVSAYIMSHECDIAYDAGNWYIQAQRNEISVLHALRVHPDYGGRGYAKELIAHAIVTAKDRGQKAIRLDVLVGNDVPKQMYLSYGFQYAGTVPITYEDIGTEMDFDLLELVL